jgi:ABC-2 type transport system permease protein
MWSLCKKEFRQFFSSLTGYIAISAFLLLNALFLFIFPDSNLFDQGYASLDVFFSQAPWILLLLIPAITMRIFAEEFRTGTFEILRTRPLSDTELVMGKYLGAMSVVVLALLPTATYVITVQSLSAASGIDIGQTIGSYIGLLLLCAVFTAVGVCASSFTTNSVAAFLSSAFVCFLLFSAFNAVSRLPLFTAGADYYIEMLGIDFHYRNMSRGVIDTRDLVYFFSMTFALLFISRKKIAAIS